MKVAVIGGGAAGFFAAINLKDNYPDAAVTIFEKSKKLLSKVKVSGGGRCNVTNGTSSISELAKAYPRGNRQLKKLFREFSNRDCMEWFEKRSVPLVIQEDNCVFPKSQDSQTIIDCFLQAAHKHAIKINTSHAVTLISYQDSRLTLHFRNNETTQSFDKIIVATGGSPKRTGLEWLEDIELGITDPVPSLFTFNMPSEKITELMGIVVEKARVKIPSTKLTATGPLLITHWGMSGPAILKLSAFGARLLNDYAYKFQVQVNWVDIQNNNQVAEQLYQLIQEHPKKQISNYRPFGLPERLWHFLISKCNLPPTKLWQDLGKTGINKLTNILCNDLYTVCLLYTSPSPRDQRGSRMPSSA